MDKLGKIRRHYWKLKLVKLPNLTVIRLKREKTKLRKVAKIYRHLYVGEQVSALHYTNVCKISRLWGAVSSLVFNKSLSNLAILLILRRSFHWCRRFCPNLLMSKVEKKWKGLLDVCWQKIRTAACASNSNTSNINSNISRTVPRPFLSYWRGEFVFKSNIWS